MCINLRTLPNGQQIGCRDCWQCRSVRVNDWVGRCVAEAKCSQHVHSVALTYGRDEEGNSDHLRAACLTYRDVQDYFWTLRNNGYKKFRYFVMGEYGTHKGRAHWHLIMFWNQQPPDDIEFCTDRFTQRFWKHGFSYYEDVKGIGGLANTDALKYVCKYLLKDTKKDEIADYRGPYMSKKPPLGHDYFMQLAQDYVDAGLAPQSLHYSFPEIIKGGKVVKYFMRKKTAENFLEQFVTLWQGQRDDHLPASQLVEEFLDSRVGDDFKYCNQIGSRKYERKRDAKEANWWDKELKEFKADAEDARAAISRLRRVEKYQKHMAEKQKANNPTKAVGTQ